MAQPPNTSELSRNVPSHIAIIMDGNGRWAEQRGLPRTTGHKHGVDAVRDAVRAAGELGVEYLTLYSFSTENWTRPEAEISELFKLLRLFIRRDLADLHKNNVIITFKFRVLRICYVRIFFCDFCVLFYDFFNSVLI